jgi:hypothetical protein
MKCSKCGRNIEYLENYFTKDEEIHLCDDCAWDMSTAEILQFFGVDKRVAD